MLVDYSLFNLISPSLFFIISFHHLLVQSSRLKNEKKSKYSFMNVRRGESNEWHQQNTEKDGTTTVQIKVVIHLVVNFGKIQIIAIMLLHT